MADKNCTACNELKDYAPNFATNGVTDTECNSLKNDTGYNPSLPKKHNDCDDLEDANDCLVGNLEDELESYDVCDWKDFMKGLLPNVYNMFKSLICAICGIWTNIHELWARVQRLECLVNFIMKGTDDFRFKETVENDTSHVVAGKGVSFSIANNGMPHASDIALTYVAGGLMISSGSCNFFTGDFDDADTVWNFDRGSSVRKSKNRKGNDQWSKNGMPAQGELIYEIRLKKSEYPTVQKLYPGTGQATGGSGYQTISCVFTEGTFAYGQHGGCSRKNGERDKDDYSDGHMVPAGWIYIQIRMRYIMQDFSDGTQKSPRSWFGIRFNQKSIEDKC